jgi:hypothetical protein
MLKLKLPVGAPEPLLFPQKNKMLKLAPMLNANKVVEPI